MQNQQTTPFGDSNNSSTVAERLSETAAQAKDKVTDLSRTAAGKIDENRHAAASGLERAASTLRERAGTLPGGEKVSNLAHGAAEKLSSTADYVREHDVNRMMSDVETMVKNSPGPSLAVAAVIGFFVGRAFSSHD